MARQSSAAGAAGRPGGSKSTAKNGKKAGGRGSGWLIWLMLAALLPFGLLVLPSMALFTVGMVPTVVALIAVRDSDGFEHLSIGILNVAGRPSLAGRALENRPQLRQSSGDTDRSSFVGRHVRRGRRWMGYLCGSTPQSSRPSSPSIINSPPTGIVTGGSN